MICPASFSARYAVPQFVPGISQAGKLGLMLWVGLQQEKAARPVVPIFRHGIPLVFSRLPGLPNILPQPLLQHEERAAACQHPSYTELCH
jgi:hypothetical protein